MANQRKQSKVSISAWVPSELKEQLAAIAAAEGVPLSYVVEQIVRNQVSGVFLFLEQSWQSNH